MSNKGLTKLIEECGELVQIAAKKIAYMDTDLHPDGESLKARLEHEIADVLASATFVMFKLALDETKIRARVAVKMSLYAEWDKNESA